LTGKSIALAPDVLVPLLALPFLWIALSWAGPALAQEPAANRTEPAAYRESVQAAISEFDGGNFSEARELFARAHAIFPNARTLRGLGMTEFELRHYVNAVRYLDQALASSTKRLEGQLRESTTTLLGRAKSFVGALRLRVSPGTSRLSMDGIPLGLGQGEDIELEIGDHILEVHAEGRLSERRAFSIRGEQVLELTIDLTPIMQAGAQPAPEAVHDRDTQSGRTPVYKRWWLWTLVGVAVVGGGTAAAVVLAKKSSTEEQPVRTENTPADGTFLPLWSR
jgi:tetratricopeptide (TPR) repeat protein